MYQFETTAQKNAFRAALAGGAVHHISATITDKNNHPLQDNTFTILDSPNFDARCLEDEKIFNIGCMYIGRLELKIRPHYNLRAAALIGGSVSLNFSIETGGEPIEIPLGVWDIVDAKRASENLISIVGNDHIGRLAVPVGIDEVGMIALQTVLDRVSFIAGVEFEQDADDILELAIKDNVDPSDPLFYVDGYCTHFEESCWDEVKMIAQLIGGFAFANREGKVEFRRFSKSSCLDIEANKRFHIEIAEQNFNVKGAVYTLDSGKSYTSLNTLGSETSSLICIPQNKYLKTGKDDEVNQRVADMYASLLGFAGVMLYPGTVEFYGDPSLDLGDMVTLKGGIGGNDVKFLIGCNYWQFRNPQTIISGGAPTVGQYASSSSGSSPSGTSVIPASVSKNIDIVTLEGYPGAVFPTARTVAHTYFGCTTDLNAVVDCTLVFMGTVSTTVQLTVYYDDDLLDLAPKTTLEAGKYSTVSFSIPLAADNGAHSISIRGSGASDLVKASGFIWGQGITAETEEDNTDYEYTVKDGEATITGYTGEDLYIEVPGKLGGADVTTISGTAFTESSVISVYIPDGVTVIE